MILVSVLICFSVIAMLLAVGVFVVLPFLKNGYRFSWDKRVCTAIALLFASIFALRLFVYAQYSFTPANVLDSFLMALKTFLADGDIRVEGHFEEIENALAVLFYNNYPKWLDECLKITAAVDDVAAPLLTLTTVISILSQVFPKIKIKISPLREKYIFSEINEETVVLAESIAEHHRKDLFKPMLIMTDAYADDESEKSTELMERLKRIGCICIKDDILSIKMRAKNRITYILLDKDKMKNLSVALNIMEQFKTACPGVLKRQNRIYTFTDLDEAEELLSKQRKELARNLPISRLDKWLDKPTYEKIAELKSIADSEQASGEKKAEAKKQADELEKTLRKNLYYKVPLVVPIREYKNVIYDLFERLPLYTPLIGKDKKELNVTVLGTGRIGTEAFLAAFWCGQMLDVKLNINAVSMDAADGFMDELNRIGESITEAAEKDIPYCGIALMNCDLSKVSFDDLLDTELSPQNTKYRVETFGKCSSRLSDTDYYIISLGSDELNVNTAYMLRCAVERAAINKKSNNNVIITVSVYDRSIESAVKDTRKNVKIYPFASFESRFSYNNVINKRFKLGVEKISDTYKSLNDGYSEKDMSKIYGSSDEYVYYKYWSNVARRLHRKYVMFSAGVAIEPVDELEGKEKAEKRMEDSIEKYVDRLRDDDLCDRLAWLEHRRWNASLWSMGYKHYDTEKNFAETKVHPCLVEIKPDRHHKLPFKGSVCTLSAAEAAKPMYDDLDRVCLKYKYSCDTKEYDYPQHSDIRLTDKQMRIYIDPQAKDYYSSKRNVDAYTFELYKPETDEDGQRVWAIHRYLLDEDKKRGLDKLYEEYKGDVQSSILQVLGETDTGFLTHENAVKMLK